MNNKFIEYLKMFSLKMSLSISILFLISFARVYSQTDSISLLWLDNENPISSYMFYDFNGDEVDEIIITQEKSNKLVIYEIHRQDSIRLTEFYSRSIQKPTFARVGDFNNDGNPELIISTNTRPPDSLKVPSYIIRGLHWIDVEAINNRDTLLKYTPIKNCGESLKYFDIVDLDKDGYNDLVGYDGKSRFYEVLYTENRKVARGLSTPIIFSNLFFNDVDHDGDLDLFFTHPRKNIRWVENKNGFTKSPVLEVPVQLKNYQIVDVDEDGDKDVIGIRNHKDNLDSLCCDQSYFNRRGQYLCIGWLENKGDFNLDTFQVLQHRFQESSEKITIVDYDSDSQTEIFLKTQISYSSTTALIYDLDRKKLVSDDAIFNQNPMINGNGELLDDLISLRELEWTKLRSTVDLEEYRMRRLKYYFPSGDLRFHDFDHDGNLDLFLTDTGSLERIIGLYISIR